MSKPSSIAVRTVAALRGALALMWKPIMSGLPLWSTGPDKPSSGGKKDKKGKGGSRDPDHGDRQGGKKAKKGK